MIAAYEQCMNFALPLFSMKTGILCGALAFLQSKLCCVKLCTLQADYPAAR